MEVVLSTAFGHQVDIQRGKANNDELYKAALSFYDFINEGGVAALNGSFAFQCQ